MDRKRQPVVGSIKVLEKILESLRIIEDNILGQSNRPVEGINNMSRVQKLAVPVIPAVPAVSEVSEATVLNNIVTNLGWFDED